MWSCCVFCSFFFFFNDTATTEIYTLSLHDALPIYAQRDQQCGRRDGDDRFRPAVDRKSTRLNSSHANSSYAVFCLKKKKTNESPTYKYKKRKETDSRKTKHQDR